MKIIPKKGTELSSELVNEYSCFTSHDSITIKIKQGLR